MAETLTLTGKVEYVAMGTGAWALVADGVTYEIYNGEPSGIRQEGATVKVVGKVRDDVMSLAMIGPILEVVSFESIDPMR